MRLALSRRVPNEIRAKLVAESIDVFSNPAMVSTEWTGPEFALAR